MAVPDNSRSAGTIVCVLVLQAIILLVEANDVLQLDRRSLRVSAEAVKVLDVAETVTSKCELVRCDTEADVSNVKRLLAVEGSTRVYWSA